MIEPTTPREMADVLRGAASRGQRIQAGGRFTKHLMAGPVDAEAHVTVTTRRLDALLAYEPRDLTVSVGAGMPFRRLQKLLAPHGQMLPLDPIYPAATVGGVVAANISGPRRRQYGTARDLVIGMQFAMLDARLVSTGGMVVKNVAGLDIGKLLIGSFGTLAVMTSINFKVLPTPPAERTFAREFPDAHAAFTARDLLLQSFVQPGAIDLLNPLLAAEQGYRGWVLLLWYGGNTALLDRAARELDLLPSSGAPAGPSLEQIGSLSARLMEKYPDGAVVRISCLLSEIRAVLEELEVPALARAGTGVVYAYFNRIDAASRWLKHAAGRGRRAVIEFASQAARSRVDLWPVPGSDFAMMKKIKSLFDPESLLNRGRLYRLL